MIRFFSPDEKATRIYVNFCNPWQKAGDHKRRLTHTRQLNTYKKRCSHPAASCGSKTDNTDLYLATQRYLAEAGFEILCKTDDLHSEDAPGNIQSEHEVMFTAEGIKTKAIIARWNGEPETPERVSTEQAEKSGKYSRVNSPLRSGHTWVIRSPYSCCLRGCCTVLGCGGFRISTSGRFWPSPLGCFVKWKAASAGGLLCGFYGLIFRHAHRDTCAHFKRPRGDTGVYHQRHPVRPCPRCLELSPAFCSCLPSVAS